MADSQAILRFRHLGMLTIFAVYMVILVGGIVRASGSGMGCPDWPTCFGQWIPPTEESQLPPNYHEIYANRGYQNTQFNPVKTWIEYANRLVGVTIGFLIFLTAWSSRVFLTIDKSIFYLS
ncbi:MAG: COX15/CtaA family protein, partial [Methylococcales bacterium]